MLETKKAWKEAEVYANKYSTLINASTERINAFISKQFNAASKLESGASKEGVARQLEGISDRNRLLVDQLTPFYQALNDCEGVERADAYISYRIDTFGAIAATPLLRSPPLINVLFVEEQGALEALRLGSHPSGHYWSGWVTRCMRY